MKHTVSKDYVAMTVFSIRYKLANVFIEDSDQTVHSCSLIIVSDGCSVDSQGYKKIQGGKLRL